MPCPEDTYNTRTNSSSIGDCDSCMADSSTEGAVGSQSIYACVCDAGFFHDTRESCAACAGGSYGTDTNATDCNNCSAGTFSAVLNATSDDVCQVCAPGTFAHEGSVECNLCPENSSSPLGSGVRTNCTCDPGFSGPNGGPCEPCAAGTFTNTSGAGVCAPCAPGFYSLEQATTACTPCASCGTEGFRRGCGNASEGDCGQCPANSVAQDGSTVIEDCKCQRGYSGADGGTCQACSAGQFKNTTGSAACSSCPSNSVSLLASVSILNCSCAAGYQGPLGGPCAACPVDFFKLSFGPQPCQGCLSIPCAADQYRVSCGSVNNGFCRACEPCPDGQYRLGCSGLDAGMCVDCGACPAGRFRLDCNYTSPGSCRACPFCPRGQYNANCSAASTITCRPCEACPGTQIRAGCESTSPGTCIGNPSGEPFDWMVVLYGSLFGAGPLFIGCCMCVFCWRSRRDVGGKAPSAELDPLLQNAGTPGDVPRFIPFAPQSYEQVLQKDYDPDFVFNKHL